MINHRSIHFSLCALFAAYVGALAPANVHGESDAPIMVVDMDRVFQGSISGKAAMSNFDQERKKRGQVVAKMENDLRKLDESIQKQASILSATAIAEKRSQFEKKRAEFGRAAQEAQAELVKYQQAEFGKVLTQIDEILKKLAGSKESRFVLDYDKRIVLFAKESLDLTNDVIEALDENSMKS